MPLRDRLHWRPGPRSKVLLAALVALAAMLGLRLADPQVLSLARLAVFDLYQRLVPRPYTPAPVRVVEIDNESLERIGQWPWPRTVVARVVRELQGAGAAAIVFDMIFAEPDRTSPARVVRTWPPALRTRVRAGALGELPDHDEVLADAVAAAPVVLGMALGFGPASRPPPRKFGFAFTGAHPASFLPRHAAATGNLPALERAASGIGVLTVPVDADGVVRRVALLATLGGEVYPSLAVEALRVAQSARSLVARSVEARRGSGSRAALTGLKVGHVVLPTSAQGEMWLHATEDVPGRSVPAWRVLQGGAELAARVAGHIVLIGASAPGLGDVSATPLDPVAPGVTIHAQILEQMLLGQFLERPDWADGAEIAGLLALGGLLILVLLLETGIVAGVVAAALGTAAGPAGSWWAYRQGMLLDPLVPALAVIVISVLVVAVRYTLAERERRVVRRAFGRYVAPAVVERLAERPEALRLGGEMRELTVMFCDIRGFTGIAEAMAAQQLTHFVNRIMTPMTEVILDAGGTIDKYMGDAIMAFWNAPLSEPRHHLRACRAALALHRCLAERTPSGDATAAPAGPVRIGVGVSSGLCCVGNFGSDRRFDYSALGDAVNLAARLEQLCKLYAVETIVAESTWRHAKGLASLELDLVQVAGKQEVVRIFALIGDERRAAEPGFDALRARHDDALAAYRRRDWAAAERLFGTCASLAEGTLDRLYAMYAERLDGLRADPPEEGWDGVWRAAPK